MIQEFHLLLDFAENQRVFRDFKIQNSVRITECSDNGDSNNQGPTVIIFDPSVYTKLERQNKNSTSNKAYLL